MRINAACGRNWPDVPVSQRTTHNPGSATGGERVSAGELVLLAAAAFAAGAVNAVAGGGSLISFPALVAVGLPPLNANVTNQIAVLPGYLAGSPPYRAELPAALRRVLALSATRG